MATFFPNAKKNGFLFVEKAAGFFWVHSYLNAAFYTEGSNHFSFHFFAEKK
jgi:hypothetical protein